MLDNEKIARKGQSKAASAAEKFSIPRHTRTKILGGRDNPLTYHDVPEILTSSGTAATDRSRTARPADGDVTSETSPPAAPAQAKMSPARLSSSLADSHREKTAMREKSNVQIK